MAEQQERSMLLSSMPGTMIIKLFDAFHLYICMCLSGELIGNVLIGGALCLAGQVILVFARLYSKRNSALLTRSMQARGFVLLAASAALLVLLLFVYPALTEHPHFVTLICAVSFLFMRQGVTMALAERLRGIWRVLALILAHAMLSAALLALVSPAIAPDAFGDIMTMVIAMGVAILAWQVASVPQPQKNAHTSDPDKLHQVSAYRIYNRMVTSVMVALNLALVTYICTMGTQAPFSMLDRFWDLVVWLVLVFGMTVLGIRFLRRGRLTRYDKPSIFAVGAAMLSVAIIGTNNNWFSGWGTLPGYFLWGVGLACILSIIISLGYDMQAVLELDMTREELTGYHNNTLAAVDWGLTLSMFLVLIMLMLMAFISEGAAETYHDLPLVRFIMNTMASWPVVVIGAALVFALMQPLNKDYAKRLAHYRSQQRKGEANPALRTGLQMQLVQRTKRILPSILRAIIRPLLPCRVIGKHNVDTENGPVVFVCNHLEIYGPLITNLHLPFYFRSWIISSMLDRDAIAAQLESGVNVVFHWAPKRVRKWINSIAAPIALRVLQSLDPIPVYKGTMREVIKTIQLTVDAMEHEDNILLFPENTEADSFYKEAGVSQFYSGFASIGSEYYKRTGNCATFYPMYADKQKRTLTIGEGIVFSPKNGGKTEKQRIMQELHSWMEAQAPQ